MRILHALNIPMSLLVDEIKQSLVGSVQRFQQKLN